MEEKDLIGAEEKSRQIIKTAVVILAILGLLTAVAVVAANLYKKLKEAVRTLNEDGVLDPADAGELADDRRDEGVSVESEA